MYPLQLKPALKDYLWGGSRLKTDFGIQTEMSPLAEAWMLSVHPDGDSTVDNGPRAGETLSSVLKDWGNDALGTRAAQFEKFPILIKLIDARDNLSVQVHPDDDYARQVEGEYGKTEMWYVADCTEGASLYFGFSKEVSKDEFRQRIENNTLLEVLNEVKVKKGDCFFIEAGTLHAIGKGLLIAEIQQNSNSTYRVYDYGRMGADGKPRPLHIEKALEVTRLTPSVRSAAQKGAGSLQTLAECRYFTVRRLVTENQEELTVDEQSFCALLILEGGGELTCKGESLALKKGDCVFIPAASGTVRLSGNMEMIASSI